MTTSMRLTVSILVLMDAALRRSPYQKRDYYQDSFNPCFDGCRPATVQLRSLHIQQGWVSILVLMDAALRLNAFAVIAVYVMMFQSLF